MERLLRLLISLSLSGFIALLGLGMTYYSVLRMVIAYRDYQDFADNKAVLELAAILQGNGVNYFEIAEKVFFLVGFLPLILIIPGLYLFGFGLKLMIGKIRQGLPEAAKKPGTSAELWISTVIYGFGVFITAPALVVGIAKAPSSVPVIFHAIETDGKAVKVWPNENNQTGSSGTYFVRFEFQDVQGRTVNSDKEVSARQGPNFKHHPHAKIAYVPGRSEKIYFAQSVPGILGYLWSFIWRIGMLYVAVCGLMANFLPEKPSPLGRLANDRNSIPINQTVSNGHNQLRPAARNGGFGRRGLS